jgi:hypothetical protein
MARHLRPKLEVDGHSAIRRCVVMSRFGPRAKTLVNAVNGIRVANEAGSAVRVSIT